MKYLYSTLFIIALCIGSFAGGYFYHKPETIVKTVEVIKNVDRLVFRNYDKVDCCDIAKNYDNTAFHQTFTVKELNPEYTDLTLKWDLFERDGEQEIKVPVYQEGNWKLFLGIGIGVAITSGIIYTGSKLVR